MRKKFFRKILSGLSILALLAAVFFAAQNSGCIDQPGSVSRPNVILILIDTLRADHLGCYGYSRNTSPQIDHIAEKGILFSHYYSASNWTRPAMMSLFSGVYPLSVLPFDKGRRYFQTVLSEKVDTLAEIMKPAGYATAALVDHPWIIASTGYLQGFDDIVYLHDSWAVSTKNGPALPNSSADPGYVRQAFGQALDRLGKRPFFLYLHLLYPHAAYDPPPPYDTMFGPGLKITREDPLKPVAPIYMAARDHKDRIVNMYDGEVRLTDTLLGELFDDMRRRGILDGSFVIITSDHGEGFWEHDSYEHGNTFYDEEIKVPLIVYPPAGQTVRNRHVDAVTSSIDLYPTIAAIGGAQVPGYIEGQSMLGLLEENAPCDDGRYFISEGARVDVGARAILKGDLKFISNKRPIFYNDKNFKDRELYNLRKDHLEQSNLADNRKDVLADMEKREKAHLSKAATFRDGLRGTLEKAKQTKGNLDALKSLGYTE